MKKWNYSKNQAMKDIENLTQEQMRSIVDHILKKIDNGSPFTFENGKVTFKDGDIRYTIYMDMFNPTDLSGFIVMNISKNIMINILKSKIKNTDGFDIITNFMNKNQLNNKSQLNNDEFFEMTNIVVDKTIDRSMKISKIQTIIKNKPKKKKFKLF